MTYEQIEQTLNTLDIKSVEVLKLLEKTYTKKQLKHPKIKHLINAIDNYKLKKILVNYWDDKYYGNVISEYNKYLSEAIKHTHKQSVKATKNKQLFLFLDYEYLANQIKQIKTIFNMLFNDFNNFHLEKTQTINIK